MLKFEDVDKMFYHKNGKLYWKVNAGPSIVKDTVVGVKNSEGYLQVKFKGSTYKVHRLIYFLENKTLPEIVDHKDTNRVNNHPKNLRAATHEQNMQNRSTPTSYTTGFKGVDVYRGQFRARITIDGVRKTIGLFKTEDEAKDARDKLTSIHHGEFAKPS